MRYKTDKIRLQWFRIEKERADVGKIKLYNVTHTLDQVTQLMFGYELMITSLLRPDDVKSYHSVGQAVDIRTWDMPLGLRPVEAEAMFKNSNGEVLTLLARLRNHDKMVQNQYEPQIIGRHPESGKMTILKGEHIHIEIDDGSIQKEVLA